MENKHKQNKQCTRCMETLHIEEFYYSPSRDRYTAKCKSCTIEYNTERRALTPRPRKVLQTDVHRKLLSGLGPGTRCFLGRYVHGYKNFILYRGPWGCVLDGELLYGLCTDDDLIYILQQRHMKLMSETKLDISLIQILDKVLLLRNACGVPIDVRFVKSLMSLDQYYLWMDQPRKLLISEVAQQLSLSVEILQFISPTEKNTSNPTRVPPVILKNSEDNSPQHIEFVEE